MVLGADTRSTSGSTVADKNCEKIHFIAPNIYCCGAGTAADTENTTGTPPPTRAAIRMLCQPVQGRECAVSPLREYLGGQCGVVVLCALANL